MVRLLKKGASPEQQEKIDYAYEISQDENFVYLLEAENGHFDHLRPSKSVGSNGFRDYGLCQINAGWHPAIVNDRRFRADWRWQLQTCLRLYQTGTVFYGKKNIPKAKLNFEVVYQ